MTRLRAAAAVVAAALLLAGCTDDSGYDVNFPDKAEIDVDTDELRRVKASARIEPCEPGAASGVNDLPPVTLPCFGGGPDVDLSSLRGPLLVNLWAGWCAPCREEMPVLQDFHERYGDRVPVLGIDVKDAQIGAAMALVVESEVTYPLLADPQDELAAKEPFTGNYPVPMLVFVRADGTIEPVARKLESTGELVDLAEQHLGVRL